MPRRGEYQSLLKARETIKKIKESDNEDYILEALAEFAADTYEQGHYDGAKEVREQVREAHAKLTQRLGF